MGVNMNDAVANAMGQTLAHLEQDAPPAPPTDPPQRVQLRFTPILDSWHWNEARLQREIDTMLAGRADTEVLWTVEPRLTVGEVRAFLESNTWFDDRIVDVAQRGLWEWAASVGYFMPVPPSMVNAVTDDVFQRRERLWRRAMEYNPTSIPRALAVFNTGRNHWVVVELDDASRRVVVYDSLQRKAAPMTATEVAALQTDMAWQPERKAGAAAMRHSFISFYRSKTSDERGEWNWQKTSMIQQRDGWNCGPCAIATVVCLIAARATGKTPSAFHAVAPHAAAWARKAAVWWALSFGRDSALDFVPKDRRLPSAPRVPKEGREVVVVPDDDDDDDPGTNDRRQTYSGSTTAAPVKISVSVAVFSSKRANMNLEACNRLVPLLQTRSALRGTAIVPTNHSVAKVVLYFHRTRSEERMEWSVLESGVKDVLVRNPKACIQVVICRFNRSPVLFQPHRFPPDFAARNPTLPPCLCLDFSTDDDNRVVWHAANGPRYDELAQTLYQHA